MLFLETPRISLAQVGCILMAIINTLQAQIVALQNAAPAAAAAPPAGAATVVFANTPQMLGANDLKVSLTKQGSIVFEQGCKLLNDKALTDGFAMTPNQIHLCRSVPPLCHDDVLKPRRNANYLVCQQGWSPSQHHQKL
jgi:hypothetical protein